MTTVQVTTAIPLTEKLRQEVERLAVQKTGDKTVQLQEKIDPAVLGGIKISFRGQVYDATVASKLQQLKQA